MTTTVLSSISKIDEIKTRIHYDSRLRPVTLACHTGFSAVPVQIELIIIIKTGFDGVSDPWIFWSFSAEIAGFLFALPCSTRSDSRRTPKICRI
ncbi:hypothetical protein BJY04DRAFT_191872 [Aspergillus karnatakaensis]|uniref:uncharacterized protein n=1 Tax=Aspergillus karnatakaensis TaxID=1810916 RepID=UPI003CCCBAC0